MSKFPFPLVWDNSMRSALVECPRKFAWEYGRHFKPMLPSIHLHAGGAWAHALETTRRLYYAEGLPPNEAIAAGFEALTQAYGDFEPPPGHAKSLPRLIEAFAYYWQAFPLDRDHVQPYRGKDGKPAIEFSFALPLSDDLLHPETGEPLIYTGRADMIATYAGAVCIYDDKTTTALGDSWAKQWNLRAQFTGYAWAAQQFNIPVSQCVIRGIAIQKTQIKHAECVTTRTPQMIDAWYTQIQRDLRRAIAMWREGYWDANFSEACSAFGGCMFQNPCMANDPEPWLKSNFSVRVWNPLTRTEEIL